MAETNKKRGYPDQFGEKTEGLLADSGMTSNLNNSNAYQFQLQDAVWKPQETPQYEDKYGGTVEQLLGAMQNRKEFSYNPYTDESYQAYRKQYLREGQRAAQNTMATAAAATGGIPSSYAVSAAAQAQNNYNAQLTDKIPELYNQAYNRYMQEFQNQAQMTQMLQNQQQHEYNRFSQDRAFDYQKNQDWINNLMNARQQEINIAANDRDFNYQQQQDRIHNYQTQQSQDFSRWLQQAQMALQIGDYGLLQSMGFDTSRANFDNELVIAQILAQYAGDTTRLRALMNR